MNTAQNKLAFLGAYTVRNGECEHHLVALFFTQASSPEHPESEFRKLLKEDLGDRGDDENNTFWCEDGSVCIPGRVDAIPEDMQLYLSSINFPQLQ